MPDADYDEPADLSAPDIIVIIMYTLMMVAVSVAFFIKEQRAEQRAKQSHASTTGYAGATTTATATTTAADAANNSANQNGNAHAGHAGQHSSGQDAPRRQSRADGSPDVRAAGPAEPTASETFFLAGRTMKWPAVGLSLFVSNIGSEHLLGLFGSAAESGWAVAYFEWAAPLHILITGWLLSPVFLTSRLITTTQYVELRYNSRLRSALSCVTLFMYVTNRMSVSVYSGATVLQSMFGWHFYFSAVSIVVLTTIYTMCGGLGAVIVTDVAQSIVLLAGCIFLLVIGLDRTGGFHNLMVTPPPDDDLTEEEWSGFFRMYRPPDDADFPTLGLMLGFNASALWYWCLDQAIVQRVLAAKNVFHARGACNLAGWLKILIVFLLVVPGIVARWLFGSELDGQSNKALPWLMKELLPPGLLGLMLSAMIAACMSSLDSILAAAGSLICLDLYQPYYRPNASEAELVKVGRIVCFVLGALTLVWLPIIDLLSDQIFVYLNSIQMCFTPPFVTIYFLGVLWPRATSRGAEATFIVGYILGIYRFVGEVVASVNPPAEGTFHAWWVGINVFHIGGIIWAICIATHIGVSLLTEPPPEHQTGWPLTYEDYCARRAANERHAKPKVKSMQLAVEPVHSRDSVAGATRSASGASCTAAAAAEAGRNGAAATTAGPTVPPTIEISTVIISEEQDRIDVPKNDGANGNADAGGPESNGGKNGAAHNGTNGGGQTNGAHDDGVHNNGVHDNGVHNNGARSVNGSVRASTPEGTKDFLKSVLLPAADGPLRRRTARFCRRYLHRNNLNMAASLGLLIAVPVCIGTFL